MNELVWVLFNFLPRLKINIQLTRGYDDGWPLWADWSKGTCIGAQSYSDTVQPLPHSTTTTICTARRTQETDWGVASEQQFDERTKKQGWTLDGGYRYNHCGTNGRRWMDLTNPSSYTFLPSFPLHCILSLPLVSFLCLSVHALIPNVGESWTGKVYTPKRTTPVVETVKVEGQRWWAHPREKKRLCGRRVERVNGMNFHFHFKRIC